MIQKKLGRRFIVNGLRTTKKMPVQLHDFSLMITMPVLVPVKSFSVSPTTLQLSDMMVEKKHQMFFYNTNIAFTCVSHIKSYITYTKFGKKNIVIRNLKHALIHNLYMTYFTYLVH